MRLDDLAILDGPTSRRRRSAWTQIRRQVGALDHAVYDAIAHTDSPLLDRTMPIVSRVADHSAIWMACALAMRATRSRRLHRAADRGVATVAVTSLLTNQVAKRVLVRERPRTTAVPLLRRARRMPSSASFPSGHSASAAAFATAVAVEYPPLAPVFGIAAAVVGFSRVATGAHFPSDVVVGLGLGAGIALLGAKLAPPPDPAPPVRSEPAVVRQPPRPEGEGVVLVVNPRSGSGRGTRIVDEVRHRLPLARIVELGPHDDPAAVLEAVAADAEVLGIGGGDGTVNTAAVVAARHGLPLAVFPAGTFNHFAGDIRVTSVADTCTALAEGSSVRVDLAYLNGEAFLNTASIGGYPRFVAIREKYEHRIGKPLAALLAGWRVVRTELPIRVEYDGRQLDKGMAFVGNSVYEPRGFAPALRPRLDDGLVDVRLLAWSTWRDTIGLLFSLATGRLARDHRYHELDVPRFTLRVVRAEHPVRVARDGELGEEVEEVDIHVDYRALTVYRPGDALD